MELLQRVARREMLLCLALNRAAAWPGVGRAMVVASRLGDGLLWYALIAALAVGGGAAGRQVAGTMAVTALLSVLAYTSLKRWVARPRPLDANTGLNRSVLPLDRWSFPSGHTTHAMAFSLVAASLMPGLLWLLAPLSLAVMTSRVVLGLHYPSDVLAAVGLGVVSASAGLALSGSLLG